MSRKPRPIALLVCAAALCIAAPAQAMRSQSSENAREVCQNATGALERQLGIPKHLLTAIARTESGRHDPETGENFAWPWTVTARGKGQYFATKAEAKAEVEILLTQGVTNIDVGCMQVNLHYHWNAFRTLDDAFDPKTNAAYAAGFLKSKFDDARNWLTAAGQYHSHTPENSRAYRIKVLSHWNRLRRDPDGIQTASADKDKAKDADKEKEVQIAMIDRERTAQVNGFLRERRREVRSADTQLDRGRRRLDELNDWRDTRLRGLRLDATVARRLAEMQVRREEKLRELERNNRQFTFEEKRRDQLERWRKTGQLIGDIQNGHGSPNGG
ncbi:MAG: lytic transglycosylase domain-containing protein [Rhodospirillaceae bacterium]